MAKWRFYNSHTGRMITVTRKSKDVALAYAKKKIGRGRGIVRGFKISQSRKKRR